MTTSATNHGCSGDERGARAFAIYRQGSDTKAIGRSLDILHGGAEQEWLQAVQNFVLNGHVAAATHILRQALDEHPTSIDIRLALAGMMIETGDVVAAESMLHTLLAQHPEHFAATFLLARLLKNQGRMDAAAGAVRKAFKQQTRDVELTIQAVELLDDCDRQQDAAALCEEAIENGSTDPRLHVYAGMLLAQLGQFDLARRRHEFVVANSDRAADWHVFAGLAGLQRYRQRTHPDFDLFDRFLHTDLDGVARASLLFALGKAHDDIEDYPRAAQYFREANALAHANRPWSRKHWRSRLQAQKARKLPNVTLAPTDEWVPIFILGMPRSGSTLLAELLARHPLVCHRGESPWLPALVERLDANNANYRDQLAHTADTYAAQLCQDDSRARWFIDKQPHNFMHVDFILALFPHAKVIHCRRRARDNALSLWMQSFQAKSQDFAYDMTDIASVIRGERQLMTHWQARYPDSIRTVQYEDLTADPANYLDALAEWLGLPPANLLDANSSSVAISTASLWQARQPVHTRSVERWRAYTSYLPQLLQIPDN